MDEFIFENDELRWRYLIKRDGTVYNLDKKLKKVKPYKDPRRPNEPPAMYFKKKDGKRLFVYLDELVASAFIPGYDKDTMAVHHLDGDITNCAVDNLYASDPISTLREVFHETKDWCKVDVGQKLYYDYYICEDGRLFNGNTSAFVLPFKDNRKKNENYLRYNLYIGKTSRDVIHYSAARLVALHFIVKPEGKDIVIYKDCNNLNIDRRNLYWGDNYDVHNKKHMTSRIFTCETDPILGKEKWKPIELDGLDYEYLSYNGKYEDDLPKLSYEDYVSEYSKRQTDSDYIKLAKFYNENYAE